MSGIDWIIVIFAGVMAGNLDRLRGDAFDLMDTGKSVEAVLYGFAVAICFQSALWWTYPLFAVLWLAGSSFGWGEPVGAALTDRKMDYRHFEAWQFGIFRRNIWAALALRGFIWGIFPATLALIDLRYLACLSMVFIFPLAVWFDKKFSLFGTWAAQEYYRGWMIATVAVAAGVLA